jgi:hypothetical protein
MTKRRFFAVTVVAVVSLVVLGACGQPAATVATDDILFLASPRGLFAVGTDEDRARFAGPLAVPTRDWSTTVRTVAQHGATQVIANDPASGMSRWEREVPGNVRVKVVSNDGALVALSPLRERYFQDGRTETKLLITGDGAPSTQRVVLDGNYEPEAFSIDGKSLFIIRYLPARNPNSYQVRRLDLITEEVEGVYTPDADLQERMGGTARVQAASPAGDRLYTLYTLTGEDGERHAFVHVLDLDELWAHCVDLPDGFTDSAEWATALTVSSDGARMIAANSKTGTIAEIDTEKLTVARTTELDLGGGRLAHASATPATIYLASGERVVAVDSASLSARHVWEMTENVRGLQATQDSRRLYVGLRRSIILFDALSGKQLSLIDPSGIGRIERFGPATQPVTATRYFTCAC